MPLSSKFALSALLVALVGNGCQRGTRQEAHTNVGANAGAKFADLKLTVGQPLPWNLDEAQISFDNEGLAPQFEYWKKRAPTTREVRASLASYTIVSEEDWEHGHAHVAGGDTGGWLVLADGTRVRWMLRPGGLAKLILPDGRLIFLASKSTAKRV